MPPGWNLGWIWCSVLDIASSADRVPALVVDSECLLYNFRSDKWSLCEERRSELVGCLSINCPAVGKESIKILQVRWAMQGFSTNSEQNHWYGIWIFVFIQSLYCRLVDSTRSIFDWRHNLAASAFLLIFSVLWNANPCLKVNCNTESDCINRKFWFGANCLESMSRLADSGYGNFWLDRIW